MTALLFVTIVSVAVAVVMSAVAWRMAREERRRSEARVDVLAADIFENRDEESWPVGVNDRFLAETHSEKPTPLFAALAIGALVVGTMIGAAVLMAGGSRGDTDHEGAAAALPAAAPQSVPLELTALGHEREGDGLVVRGTVHSRETVSPGSLTAVVFVLDGSGVVVGSGRAPVEIGAASAASGVESSFVVRINGVGAIHRYRVSFRNQDRTIAHIDRRAHTVTAQVP
jgi:hypothetical protein